MFEFKLAVNRDYAQNAVTRDSECNGQMTLTFGLLVIPEFLRPIHRNRITGIEIVSQLLVSTATPMVLLLGNTSSESKITRPKGLLFPNQLRANIGLYLSQ